MQKRDDAKFNDEPVISTNPVDIAIQKFDNHPSANLIRDKVTLSDMFQFESFSLDDILKEMANLTSDKNGTVKNTPTRFMKEVADICSAILTTQNRSNEMINKKSFPTNLKLADVSCFSKD